MEESSHLLFSVITAIEGGAINLTYLPGSVWVLSQTSQLTLIGQVQVKNISMSQHLYYY